MSDNDFIVSGGTGFAVDTDELARCSVLLASAVTDLDRAALSLLGLETATEMCAARALVVNSVGAVAAQLGEAVLQPHITGRLQQRYSRAVALSGVVRQRVDEVQAACAAARATVDGHRSALNSAIHLYGGAESEALDRLLSAGGLVTFGTGMLTGSTPGWWNDTAGWGSFASRLNGAPGRLLLPFGDGDGSAATERLVRAASPLVLGAGLLGLVGMFTSPMYWATRAERSLSGYGPASPIAFDGGRLTYHGQPVRLSDVTVEQAAAMVASVFGQELTNTKDSLLRGYGFAAGRVHDFATSELLPRGLGAAGGAAGAAVGAAVGAAIVGSAGAGTGAVAGGVGAAPGGVVGGAAGGGVGALVGRAIGTGVGTYVGERLDEPVDNFLRSMAERRLVNPNVSDNERRFLGFYLKGLNGDAYVGADAGDWRGRGGVFPDRDGAAHSGEVRVAQHGVVRLFGGENRAVPGNLPDLIRGVGEIKPEIGDPEVGCVRIQERAMPGGESSYVVMIPGTTSFLDNWSGQPHDIGSDLEGVAGLRSAQVNEVVKAMDQAGIKPGDPVMLAGHSGGGIAAAEIAADPVLQRRFNVGAVLSVGAPIGNSDIPQDVRVLSLENRADPVLALDGRPMAPSQNHVTISGTLPEPPGGWTNVEDTHLTPAYAELARAAEREGLPEYEEFWRIAREEFGVGDEEVDVRTRDFVGVRVGR